MKDYGRLAKLDLSKLKEDASGRLDADEYEKEDAKDFVLWKAWSKDDGDNYWETDLGKGRPGWHIECSAMSSKFLGETFDIHTGGVDLVFPHHENEIAQSQCANSKPFVKYWIHCEHLLVDGRKMSKSLGNFYTLRDVLKKGYEPMAIRYELLATHYRQKLNFTFKGVDAAKHSLERLQDFITALQQSKGKDGGISKLVEKVKKDFTDKMDDDLNISEALAAVFSMVKDVNKLIAEGKIGKKNAKEVLEVMKGFDSVLGVMSFEETSLDSEIEALIQKREEARNKKDFATADKIRDELKAKGIILEDTKDGVRWKKV
jgi:cysteinyl-tRNA synthetase